MGAAVLPCLTCLCVAASPGDRCDQESVVLDFPRQRAKKSHASPDTGHAEPGVCAPRSPCSPEPAFLPTRGERSITSVIGRVMQWSSPHVRPPTPPCRVFATDVKLRSADDRIYYPDVMVGCGAATHVEMIVEAPSLIAEVISRATRATDRREKLDAYRRMPSLLSVPDRRPAAASRARLSPDGRRRLGTGRGQLGRGDPDRVPRRADHDGSDLRRRHAPAARGGGRGGVGERRGGVKYPPRPLSTIANSVRGGPLTHHPGGSRPI